MRVRYLVGAALLAVSISTAACDESLDTVTGPTPNLVPTFSSIQREIFDTTDSSGRLACINCHAPIGGRAALAGLNLTSGNSYAALVGVSSVETDKHALLDGQPSERNVGLYGMIERTELAGGRLHIRTSPGRGICRSPSTCW